MLMNPKVGRYTIFGYQRFRVVYRAGHTCGDCDLQRFFPQLCPLHNPIFGVRCNAKLRPDRRNVMFVAKSKVKKK